MIKSSCFLRLDLSVLSLFNLGKASACRFTVFSCWTTPKSKFSIWNRRTGSLCSDSARVGNHIKTSRPVVIIKQPGHRYGRGATMFISRMGISCVWLPASTLCLWACTISTQLTVMSLTFAAVEGLFLLVSRTHRCRRYNDRSHKAALVSVGYSTVFSGSLLHFICPWSKRITR